MIIGEGMVVVGKGTWAKPLVGVTVERMFGACIMPEVCQGPTTDRSLAEQFNNDI
jgi:hypothetical protein